MKTLLLFGALALSINVFAQSTVKIGNLEVMTEDLGEGMEYQWEDAMKACADLGDGWRLPTKDELNILYVNKVKIGGFVEDNIDGFAYYWSSTENDSNVAEFKYFGLGKHSTHNSDYVFYVRAVRTF